MAQGSVGGRPGAGPALAALALAALAACATPAPPPAPTRAPPPVVTAPPPSAPVRVAPAQPSTPPRPADACGAAPLQYLVGKPHTQIPVPVFPGRRRVVCSTCVMTQDIQSWRQTIVYDARTGLVTSVRCG